MNRRARTRAIAGSWRLPLVVLVGVLAAGAVVTVYGALNGRSAAPETIRTSGVVIRSEPCATPGARDTVRVEAGGRTQRLPINACGNPMGFQLDVEVLPGVDGAGPTVRLAGTGGQPGRALAERISAVLLVLAGLAGAALVVQLWPPPRSRPAPEEPVAELSDDPVPVDAGPPPDGIAWPRDEPADRPYD